MRKYFIAKFGIRNGGEPEIAFGDPIHNGGKYVMLTRPTGKVPTAFKIGRDAFEDESAALMRIRDLIDREIQYHERKVRALQSLRSAGRWPK